MAWAGRWFGRGACFGLRDSVQETKTPGVVMDAFLKLFCLKTDSQEAWDSEDREGKGGSRKKQAL